jgi:hypothetical protein
MRTARAVCAAKLISWPPAFPVAHGADVRQVAPSGETAMS